MRTEATSDAGITMGFQSTILIHHAPSEVDANADA